MRSRAMAVSTAEEMASDPARANATAGLPGAGEMARRFAEHEWASAPLGPMTAWPQSLKVLVQLMLASPLIASIACGPERLLLYNDAAARLYGDRHPLALGRPLAESFPESYPQVSLFYDRVFAGECVHVPAQPLDLRGDGISHVFDAYLTPVRDEAGQVAYAFMTGFDISERLRAEAERDLEVTKRQESEDRLRLALEVAEVGTWTWNLQDNTGYLDARSAVILGLPAGPLANVGEAQRATIHPDDLAQILEETRVGITGREPFSLNYRVIHADGSVHFVASRIQAFTSATGVPSKLAGTNRDVTAERQAELGLREAKERQAFLLRLSDALRPLVGSVAVQGEACRLLGDWLNVERAYYVEVDEASGIARVERDFIRGASPSLVGDHPIASFSWSVDILRRGECHAVADTQTSPLVPAADRAALIALQVAACMGAPLIKNGRLVGAVCVTQSQPRAWSSFEVELLREVAERIWAAVQQARAEAALRTSEQRFRLLVENVQEYALFQTDREAKIRSWNPGAERLFGYAITEMLGQDASCLLTPEDQRLGIMHEEISRVLRGTREQDARWLVRRDGSKFWAQWVSEPVYDEAGELRGIVKVLRDETERKQTEERQLLLMGELNHRVKNTLAQVQSMADQTLQGTPDPAQFAEKFQARLQALSSAHNLLTRRSWESADVTDITRLQLTFDGDAEHIALDGPAALLTPQSTVALSLVLHELGTNARKYGALSAAAGRLHLHWRIREGEPVLRIEWTESGGPPVRPPERRGFGTTLIEKSLRGVGGKAELRFAPEGLVCHLQLPLAPSKNGSTSRAEGE